MPFQKLWNRETRVWKWKSIKWYLLFVTDFSVNNNIVDLQIPWLLLNFSDPYTQLILSDFHIDGCKVSQIVNSISIGAAIMKDETDAIDITFGEYQLDEWNLPVFHERLKQSYYIIQEYFQGIEWI